MDSGEIRKIVTGLLLALVGAGLSAGTAYVASIPAGIAQLILAALWSAGVNAVRKWLQAKGYPIP